VAWKRIDADRSGKIGAMPPFSGKLLIPQKKRRSINSDGGAHA